MDMPHSIVKAAAGGALLFSLALLAACQGKENPALVNLSPGEFSAQIKAKGDSVILIDIRTPGEIRSGRIPGAIALDFQDPGFAAEVAKLPAGKQIYVYCRSGGRSQASAQVFLSAGFKQIGNLEDGIIAWQAAGLPVGRD